MGHGTMYTITLVATCDETQEATKLAFQLINLLLDHENILTAEVTRSIDKPKNNDDLYDEPPPEWSFGGYDNYPGKPL